VTFMELYRGIISAFLGALFFVMAPLCFECAVNDRCKGNELFSKYYWLSFIFYCSYYSQRSSPDSFTKPICSDTFGSFRWIRSLTYSDLENMGP